MLFQASANGEKVPKDGRRRGHAGRWRSWNWLPGQEIDPERSAEFVTAGLPV